MADLFKKTATFTLSTLGKGVKETVKIELFPAIQWRRRHRPWKKGVMYPRPPIQNNPEWWQGRYRVKINNHWYNRQAKYVFFSHDQITKIATRLFSRHLLAGSID